MSYTHKIIWDETFTKGNLKGLEVTKQFSITRPGSRSHQKVLDRLQADPNVRNARILPLNGV